MIRSTLLFGIVATLVVSCSQERDCGCGPEALIVVLAPVSADGEPMLTSANFDAISISIKSDEEYIPFFGAQYLEDEPIARIKFRLEASPADTTFVDWNPADRDTLTHTSDENGSMIRINGHPSAPDASGIIYLQK